MVELTRGDASPEIRDDVQGRGLFGNPVRAAGVAVTRDRDALHQQRQPIDGGRPLERVRVAERRDGAAFEQVPGEHDGRSRDKHDRVVVGVAAAQVAQLDLTIAHVHDGLLLERPVGRVDDDLAQLGGELGQLARPVAAGARRRSVP